MDLFIRSSVIPVCHGFSLRTGGVSLPPYDSLNLRLPPRLSAEGGLELLERIDKNLQLLSDAAGFSTSQLHTVTQVHGDRVIEANLETRGLMSPVEADGIWTSEADQVVAVSSADCVPILIYDPIAQSAMAVHSGWKGTLKEIARRAVDAMVSHGGRPENLIAALGPSIRSCCYGVSGSLSQQFTDLFGPSVVECREGKNYLNLVGAITRSLGAAGLSSNQIEVLPQCSACHPQLFFSHRRDQGATGRHLSFISLDPQSR